MTYSSNTTVTTSDSTDSGEDVFGGKNLSALSTNPIIFVIGGILFVLILSFVAYSSCTQISKDARLGEGGAEAETSDASEAGKGKSEGGEEIKRSPSRSKSVRWLDEASNNSPLAAYVTPQAIPEAQHVVPIPDSPQSPVKSPQKKMSTLRAFSKSMISLFWTDSEDASESFSDTESDGDDRGTAFDIESPTEYTQSEVQRASSNLAEYESVQRRAELGEMPNRSKSVPISDDNGFYVGEQVEYCGRSKWKRGVVQSLHPLKIKGDGNMRAKQYSKVRKIRTRTTEELLEMDVKDMTDEDYKNLILGARRDTRCSQAALYKSMQSRAKLVDTITKG